MPMMLDWTFDLSQDFEQNQQKKIQNYTFVMSSLIKNSLSTREWYGINMETNDGFILILNTSS